LSGIVGIVNLDGAPVSRELLQRLTEYMIYRGPDARELWVDSHVGFGHAMLRTTIAQGQERQPLNINSLWITADARVDGRWELIEKLSAKGLEVSKNTPDAELILKAYQVWGPDCVNHLLGDFAFAIWDESKQRLFCARDHFGVKPFYYALVGSTFVFSNTLNCVRLHPEVRDELNDLAIADFLVFGSNQEVDTTAFADIQRLPAAHCLMVEMSQTKTGPRRYWTLPVDGYIRYKRDEEYVEHFNELMRVAVGDRLRSDKIAIYMSGGMDSTTVAAFAKEVGDKQFADFDLRAYCAVYDRLIPDEERYYSGLAATKLGIPIHYRVTDDFDMYEGPEQIEVKTPEPVEILPWKSSGDKYNEVEVHSRVALKGHGGDLVFYTWGAYFYVLYLLKHLKWPELVAQLGKHLLSHGRLPQPGVRSRIKKWLGMRPWRPPYPQWINPELAKRLDLPKRWERIYYHEELVHPVRPEAYRQLTSRTWAYDFEYNDPGMTGYPGEIRYPFFDLRLVNYLLAIPVVPWCLHKELMRVAMRGILPEEVRLRPKTPLRGDPIGPFFQQPTLKWIDRYEPTPALAKYVVRSALPQICGMEMNFNEALINLRGLSLDLWLQNKELVKGKSVKEEYYELKA